MNLYDFQTEVKAAKDDFAESVDSLFRKAMESLHIAHSVCQERIDRAKAELFGEPMPAQPDSEDATYVDTAAKLESYRRARDI